MFQMFLHLSRIMDQESKQEWLVVYVASRQEKSVAKQLIKKGVEAYLPLVKKLQQWSDRKKWVEFPMFNGYLFVRPMLTQRDSVLEARGVLNYLRFNGKDAIVTQKEIDILKKIEEAGYYSDSISKPEDFELGEQLMVTEGPLRGHTVTLTRKDNETHFLVSIEALGQAVKLNLPFEVLRKA